MPGLNVPNSGPVTAETSTSSTNTVPARPHSGNGRAANGFKRSQSAALNRPILAADESARLRDGMLAEIESIASSAAATAWANTMLHAKNTLTANDARAIESAFETKLAGLPAGDIVADELLLPVLSASNDGVASSDGAMEPASATRASLNDAQSADHQDCAPPQQRAPPICAHATVSGLRQAAFRPASSAVCSASRARSKGQ